MRILVGGSTGLVGTELVKYLTSRGHEVTRLVRKKPNSNERCVVWNPSQGTIDAAGIEGFDAVIHLGGDNIAHGRWTAGKKRLIRDSRVISTQLLASTLAGLSQPPKVFVCASAIGFYGDRGDDVMTEQSQPGPSFLSTTCCEWENATAPASKAGIRVVNVRIGVVLTPKGGALQKMLTPFKLCVGGRVGNGRQWWSWIALDDLVRVLEHATVTESLSGPVNGVAPGTVNNRTFTKLLGRVLRRPTIIPMPAIVVSVLLGEMGDELLLGSTRVVPQRLEESGFQFSYPTLEPALQHLLK